MNETMDRNEEWLTTQEAAKEFSYSIPYFHKLAGQNKIRHMKRGRFLFVNKTDLQEHKRRMDTLGPQKHTSRASAPGGTNAAIFD